MAPQKVYPAMHDPCSEGCVHAGVHGRCHICGSRGEAKQKRYYEGVRKPSFATIQILVWMARTKKPSKSAMREAAMKATQMVYDLLGHHVAATAEVMKRSPTTVREWVKAKAKIVPSTPKRHSLKYASDYEQWMEDFLRGQASQGRPITCKDIQLAWEARFGKEVPLRTLRRITKDVGIRARKQRLVQRFTFQHKMNRLAFAQEHLEEDFGRWMFTDAHQIYLGCTRHKGSTTTMVPRGVSPVVEYTKNPPRLKVYGGITTQGLTRLLPVTGTTGVRSRFKDGSNRRSKGVGSEEYRKDVLPWLFQEGQRLFKKKRWVFQQDGDGAHRSKRTLEALEEMSVRENVQVVINWPPLSPDLSPIENVWSMLDRRVAKMHPSTLEELKTCVWKAWSELSQSKTVKSLMGSMRKRMEAVIQENGGRTKY